MIGAVVGCEYAEQRLDPSSADAQGEGGDGEADSGAVVDRCSGLLGPAGDGPVASREDGGGVADPGLDG